MSSNTSSRLPAVGTTFASIAEFEVAACTAARNAGYSLSNFDSHKDRNLTLHCDGNGNKHALKSSGKKRCTCVAHVHKDGACDFEVKRSVNEHSCSLASPDSPATKLARTKMERRIEDLKALVRARRANDEAGTSKAQDVEEDEKDEQELAAATGPLPFSSLSSSKVASQPAPRTPRVKKKTGSSSKRKRPPFSPSSGPRHPLSKLLLVEDFEKMAKGRRLTLPNTCTFFPNTRALLVHIYAYAQQQNLPLVHSPSSPRRIALICKPIPPSPRCTYEVVIREEDDGRWHVVSSKEEHDAAMHAKAGLAIGPERPR